MTEVTTAPVELESVHKSFDMLHVLRGASLRARSGECVALLGRNGAGKSTLIRILSGIVLPDSGHVRIAGRDVVRERRACQARIGHLFGDERAWFWRLTGRQNLEFFAALYGLDRAQARARAAELIEAAGLAEFGDKPFGTYSSGMRLRLAVARALLHRPPVLVLDEPSRTLDIPATRRLWDLVREQVAAGTAVLIATHDVHEATTVADRCTLLHEGTITDFGAVATAAELERSVLSVAGDGYRL